MVADSTVEATEAYAAIGIDLRELPGPKPGTYPISYVCHRIAEDPRRLVQAVADLIS